MLRWILVGVAVVPAWAAAAPPAGKAIFDRSCASCHSMEQGEARLGPSLAGVVGRKAAAQRGFAYSAALKVSGKVWTAQELDAFITNSRAAVPGNRMAFPGLANPRDRAALILYLRSGRP